MAAPHILILRTGHTHPEVIRRHGDYDRWFTDSMEGMGCRFTVHDVPDAPLPPVDGHDGVLVTGSGASVVAPETWMEPLADFLTATRQGPPVLAVCLAAQLAAQALGGTVERNPKGWEIGTVGVTLTDTGRADPLFEGVTSEPEVQVQSTHEDAIIHLPAATTLLASNAMAPVQAFAHERLRAVQFHPEASAGVIRTLIDVRRPLLEKDALEQGQGDAQAAREHVARLEDDVRETGSGRRMLENWVRRFVG